MSVLSDKTIRNLKNTLINPFRDELVQPASYELTLDPIVMVPSQVENFPDNSIWYDVQARSYYEDSYHGGDPIPVPSSVIWKRVDISTQGGILLNPGVMMLASSNEILMIPNNLMARFEGKSSLGRIGLMVHVTAGYVDPGFNGQLTVEMYNVSPYPIYLRTGTKIGQLSFHTMDYPVEVPYGDAQNHYQNQMGVTPAR
jgi:dCTP deaminase